MCQASNLCPAVLLHLLSSFLHIQTVVGTLSYSLAIHHSFLPFNILGQHRTRADCQGVRTTVIQSCGAEQPTVSNKPIR